MTDSQVDIAIVGGGPSGLGLAALLERSGYSYTVFERSAKSAIPRGGSLDLHPGSGQRVIQEAGLEDEFNKYARRDAATLHTFVNYKLEPLLSFGEGRDAPEIDRSKLCEVLLTGVPSSRIQYSKKLTDAHRDANGKIVLSFDDGTHATGFKLVVGADGVHSKIRPLVSKSSTPLFLNQFLLSFSLPPSSPAFSLNTTLAPTGPKAIIGRHTFLWDQLQGDGTYRLDLGFSSPSAVAEASSLDLSDLPSVKTFLLQEKYFGAYHPTITTVLAALEPFQDGSVHRWPLYIMPPELISWEAQGDVTLIGDAAHVTTPFVGEGVNRAMHDAVVLWEMMGRFGVGLQANRGYEEVMMPLGRDLVTRSLRSGGMFFSGDAGRGLVEAMTGGERAIGAGNDSFVVKMAERVEEA